MRRKKPHSGFFHCTACLYEVELIGETSLKCEDCGGPLTKGPLPQADEEEFEEEEEEGEEE